jgi:hypothetical protein
MARGPFERDEERAAHAEASLQGGPLLYREDANRIAEIVPLEATHREHGERGRHGLEDLLREVSGGQARVHRARRVFLPRGAQP